MPKVHTDPPAHLPHPHLTQLPSGTSLEPVAEAPQQAKSGLKVMGRNGGREWGALRGETYSLKVYSDLMSLLPYVGSPSRVWGGCEAIGTWEELTRGLGGCEIAVFTQAEDMLPKPPLAYSLGHLSEARGRPGFSCKDFAVLSTHVLDLASLWIRRNRISSLRKLPVGWYACLREQAPAR